jgi:hypothetical protein
VRGNFRHTARVPTFHQHLNPVRRDEADFLIQVRLHDDDQGNQHFEQLWVQELGDRRFRLCCIPCFAYDLALGDKVETDDDLVVRRVIERSGAWTLRIWFGDGPLGASERSSLANEISQMGAMLEPYSERLVAISAPDDDTARRIRSRLETEQEAGRLHYETGWS